MKSEGYGGRGGNHTMSNGQMLDGVLSTCKERPAGVRWRKCQSTRCKRWFKSRQDGDYYCSERCDIDMHPSFQAGKE